MSIAPACRGFRTRPHAAQQVPGPRALDVVILQTRPLAGQVGPEATPQARFDAGVRQRAHDRLDDLHRKQRGQHDDRRGDGRGRKFPAGDIESGGHEALGRQHQQRADRGAGRQRHYGASRSGQRRVLEHDPDTPHEPVPTPIEADVPRPALAHQLLLSPASCGQRRLLPDEPRSGSRDLEARSAGYHGSTCSIKVARATAGLRASPPDDVSSVGLKRHVRRLSRLLDRRLLSVVRYSKPPAVRAHGQRALKCGGAPLGFRRSPDQPDSVSSLPPSSSKGVTNAGTNNPINTFTRRI